MLYGLGLWSPAVHTLVTAVHIFAGTFWLGWMMLMFAVLRPVLIRVTPERASGIQRQIRRRVRGIVFWLIPLILLTGLHNMAYLGLLDLGALFQTSRGHRMLAKLGAAGILFGVYYLAPILLQGSHEEPDEQPPGCHGAPDVLVRRASAALHVVAFASGITAAVLGVSLGA